MYGFGGNQFTRGSFLGGNLFRKTYILPNGYENLEMEVAVEVVSEDSFDSDAFWIRFLCSITITDKKNPDNSFTVYGISDNYNPSTLYKVIMEPDKNFLFYPAQLRKMIVSDADRFEPFDISECLENLFVLSSSSGSSVPHMVVTDAFSQCLSRVSKDINSYYQARFFENNSYLNLKKSPDDMVYIFEACKSLSNFK